MIKCVIIDLLGVIVDEEKVATQLLRRFLGDRCKLSPDEIKLLFGKSFKLGYSSPQHFWKEMGVASSEYERIESEFIGSWRTVAGAKKGIAQLASSYNLLLASELPRSWGEQYLANIGVTDFFSGFTFSSDSGNPKKSKAFFDEVCLNLAESASAPNESIYVDDKIANLTIPSEIGMRPILFKRDGDCSGDTENVTSWSELIAAIADN